MKKVICMVVSLVIILSSFSVCFGQTYHDAVKDISTRYIGVFSHEESFDKGIGMRVEFYGRLTPKTQDSFDKVDITLKVIKLASGGKAYERTFVTSYDYIKGCFRASDSCNLTSIGTYYMEATYKCHKDNVLVETITGMSPLVSV